jgi:fructose-1,6-bisphosphatase/inositol monophosphatase family enzyme
MSENLCISRDQVEAALAALFRGGLRLIEAQPHARWRLKDDGMFLTELDIELQSSLEGPLCAAFPGCVFVGEEDALAAEAARAPKPRLVLDPIDGTAAFARGFNFFSISLGVIDSDGEPLVGIVYMPARGKWYAGACEAAGWVWYAVSAVDGCVEFKPFDLPKPKQPVWRLKDSYVYVSSDAHRQLDMAAFEGKVRALGPSAGQLALLLDRTPDPGAVILTRYKLWDVIAGLALARAAGFEIRDLRRPKEALTLPHFVSELVSSGDPPPLVVGAADVVSDLIRTVKYLGECP